MALEELAGEGWVLVDPPARRDGESVIARHDGEPIKAGVLTDKIQDSEYEVHRKYRSGCYDVEIKVDFEIGRGRLHVERAEGYDG